MKPILVLACVCTLALCLLSPLAAEDEYPNDLVRVDTTNGDISIVSINVSEAMASEESMTSPGLPGEVETGEGDELIGIRPAVEDIVIKLDEATITGSMIGDGTIIDDLPREVETGEGDELIGITPDEVNTIDAQDNGLVAEATDDPLISPAPEETESGSTSKTLGGIALLGCLGTSIVAHRKVA